jgi:putative NIF3 family GTP cyclohydrolase 1 type 2
MEEFLVTRRRFLRLAGAGAALAPAFVLRGQHNSSEVSAREVVKRIQRNVGIPWFTPTADEFKVGDPDLLITGITTTFMSTLELLQRSVVAGNNFVITHEPTFWSATDVISDLRDDPLYRYKLEFIEKRKLVIWRFHDHWHAHRPDGIFVGWEKAMGWGQYVNAGAGPMSHSYTVPEMSLEELALQLRSKLNLTSIRLVGDPKLRVSRVAHVGHYITQCMQVLPHVDVILAFECREWEGAEYVRDAIAAGMSKAYIQLPHEGGEEAGMDECARWIRTFVPEVPVQFIPSGDPFWIPTAREG